jgi:hypothetical protein
MIDLRWSYGWNVNPGGGFDRKETPVLQYRQLISGAWSEWIDVQEHYEPHPYEDD